MGCIILLVRCIYIGNNGSRFQEKVLQLLIVSRIEIDVGRCRSMGAELVCALFDLRFRNNLVMVMCVQQFKSCPVLQAFDGALYGTVFGLGLAGVETNKQHRQKWNNADTFHHVPVFSLTRSFHNVLVFNDYIIAS